MVGSAIRIIGAALMIIWGIVLISFGIFSFFDGLLPTKSEGPNPYWPEVLIGFTMIVAGWAPFAVLRLRRLRKAHEND